MKNWKTTVGGSLASLGLAIVAINPNSQNWRTAGLLIAALGTFFAHLFAMDRPGGDGSGPGTTVVTLLLAGLFLFTGCSTAKPVGGTQKVSFTINPDQTSKAIKIVVTRGAILGMAHDGNVRSYLQASLVVLQSATESGVYDPAALKASLSTISVKELRSTEAQQAIGAGMDLYEVFVGDLVTQKLDLNVWAKPVLEALRDAIASALAQ